MLPLTAALALAFALVHIFIDRLSFLDTVPRSRWLSFAGGVAVSYVFLHILPELGAHQETFALALDLGAQAAETRVYLVALAGLAVFYGLERAAKMSRSRSVAGGGDATVEKELFWLHIGAFALYNVLVGYLLLHREEAGLTSLMIYFVAMALHFVTSDFGLRLDCRERYDDYGRWIIAGAVFLGWAIGTAVALPEIVIGFLFAFLAGGVVLNVLKEELPEERRSRFWPFVAGCTVYALLILVEVG